MSQRLQEYATSVGFPYAKNLILTFIGGSQMHGAKLEDTDDTDWYGLYVEPREKVLGVDAYEHFVHTTGGERGGNRPGDTDVCLYGLRKWAHLACKGNPSVLHFLFAKPEFQHFIWAQLGLAATTASAMRFAVRPRRGGYRKTVPAEGEDTCEFLEFCVWRCFWLWPYQRWDVPWAGSDGLLML